MTSSYIHWRGGKLDPCVHLGSCGMSDHWIAHRWSSKKLEKVAHVLAIHILQFSGSFSSGGRLFAPLPPALRFARLDPGCLAMTSQESAADVRAQLEREEALDLVDPLRHFLAPTQPDPPSSSSSSSTAPTAALADIRDLPSATDYSIVPQQSESIIDRRTTIRYYRHLARRPELLQDSPPAHSATQAQGEQREYWDVHLKLDMSTGCGGKIWPAAEVLGAYIAAKYSTSTASPPLEAQGLTANTGYNKHHFDWRHKTIVELGSGTGLVGYLVHALSLDGCRIYVTDQEAMLALMRENLHLNFPPSSASASASLSSSSEGFVRVAELDWAVEPDEMFTKPMPDVLLLADCVYLEAAFQPLIDTMAALSTPETEILFCYQKRRKADKRFFALLKKRFVFQDVADDDPARASEYRRQGTQLLRIRKK